MGDSEDLEAGNRGGGGVIGDLRPAAIGDLRPARTAGDQECRAVNIFESILTRY